MPRRIHGAHKSRRRRRHMGSGAGVIQPNTISNLLGWYKADALALVDGNAVASWTDSGALGNTIAQGTGAAQPTYKANIIGTKPIVRFDGGDWLEIADANEWTPSVNSITAFVVHKPTSVAATQQILGKGGASSYEWGLFTDATGAGTLRAVTWQQAGATNMQASSAGATVTTAAFQLDTFWVNYNVEIRNYHNGGAKNTSSSVTATVTNGADKFAVGRRGDNVNLYTGDMAEILVYNRALIASELDAVHAYLADKYALTVTAVS